MMRLMEKFHNNAMQASILLVIFLGGAFSFYQVGSSLFLCGREYAGSEIRYWLILSGIQSVLFLAQGLSSKVSQSYRLLQLLTLPLVLIVLAQLAIAYPRIFIYIAFLVAFYWYTAWLVGKLNRIPLQMPQVGAAIVETVVFVLLTIVIHSTIAFVLLHTPNIFLSDRIFFIVLTISALVATWIIRTGPSFKRISINQIPPLGLLIIILLRAKFPDGAYDSLFYKATLPIMIADWRTAITGAMDHTLLGTDFFEIISSQLRILDSSYSPAMISVFSFSALWVLVPVAMDSLLPKNLGWGKFATNTATLLLVSLSEMLIAAGTSYHEPIIGLLVVASLLALPLSWIFLGAAIAGKITVLFIVPLIIGIKLIAAPSERYQVIQSAVYKNRLILKTKQILGGLFFSDPRPSKNQVLVVIVCMALTVFVIGEQFYRNLAYSGRLMGVSEELSSLTDPNNRKLAPPQNTTIFDVVAQRGVLEKVGTTFVHILTLDRWIKPTELGFHVMPTSRIMAVLAILIIFVIAFPTLRRNRRLLVLYLLWGICAFALLNFFSQGRHLFPLSIGAAILVALILGEVIRKSEETGNRTVEILFCFVVSFAAIGDQVVGSFINNAWECRRNIASSVVTNNYDHPESTIEHRLTEIVKQYRLLPASHLGGSPSILCEHQIERMHYLGAHYIYADATLALNKRHLSAQPGNSKLLPTSLLAVCFIDPGFPDQILSPEIRNEFVEVPSAGKIHILVSKPLLAGAKSTSLVGSQMNALSWTNQRDLLFNFLENWDYGKPTNLLPADTPSGKGVFSATIDNEIIGFLISPYGIKFDNIDFSESSKIEVDLGMFYSNSDGMLIELTIEDNNGVKQSAYFNLKPKPADSINPKWVRWNIPIQPSIEGKGKVTILAKSDGGNSTADWAIFKKLILIKN